MHRADGWEHVGRRLSTVHERPPTDPLFADRIPQILTGPAWSPTARSGPTPLDGTWMAGVCGGR
jgi:hypothetical protein